MTTKEFWFKQRAVVEEIYCVEAVTKEEALEKLREGEGACISSDDQHALCDYVPDPNNPEPDYEFYKEVEL